MPFVIGDHFRLGGSIDDLFENRGSFDGPSAGTNFGSGNNLGGHCEGGSHFELSTINLIWPNSLQQLEHSVAASAGVCRVSSWLF